MMADMVAFSNAMLDSLATFLQTPPVFYLFCLICFCFIAKAFKILIERR